MHDWLVAHAPLVRMVLFLATLFILAALESAWPRRPRERPRRERWPANLAITVLNGLIAGLIPLGPLGAALWAERERIGLFHLLSLPPLFSPLAGFLLLDCAIYLQHVAFHAFSPLWRLHRMHHADIELDVTTGGRFHTLEILLSSLYKMAIITACGISPPVVVIFEVVLNLTSMFNHANLTLPERIEPFLRRIVVTPDMHRIHHSIHPEETNSNFGFNLPIWDRLFGTYRPHPREGHIRMRLGLEYFRGDEGRRLLPMWLIPFRTPPLDPYPMAGGEKGCEGGRDA